MRAWEYIQWGAQSQTLWSIYYTLASAYRNSPEVVFAIELHAKVS